MAHELLTSTACRCPIDDLSCDGRSGIQLKLAPFNPMQYSSFEQLLQNLFDGLSLIGTKQDNSYQACWTLQNRITPTKSCAHSMPPLFSLHFSPSLLSQLPYTAHNFPKNLAQSQPMHSRVHPSDMPQHLHLASSIVSMNQSCFLCLAPWGYWSN